MAVRKINIDDSEISVIFGLHDEDYICLTDMVKAGDNSDRTNIVIQNWMRRKDTISYLGVWENLHNPNFKSIEFDAIKNASGTNRFILTAKEWIERTGAIGIIAKSGRYGGTYAHKDIAYHFGMWLSPEFNLLVVKEFQRLKEEEQKALGWSAKRELAKINYHIHTDAIKEHLVPQEIDLIEECDGQISAFEYKWKAGKVVRLPLPFSEAYPDATFQTITPDNYQEFV